ncbi:MAG: DNA methyltransferase, partial [Candidatus Brocadiaceae bacterium]
MTLIETKARQHEQFYTNVHRKLLGTHYTPDSVVDYIVNRTLQPYVESPELLSTIKILDPACGSGLFLLKAYDVLADHWKKTFGRFTQKDALHIIENSLFGIDIDEQSVLATKRHLMQKASFVDVLPYKIAPNIVVGDALYLRSFSKLMQLDEQAAFMSRFGPNFSKHKFHCIVGNPPYIRTQNIPKEKRDYYSTVYSTAAGRFDISGLFIELSEYLLKEKG